MNAIKGTIVMLCAILGLAGCAGAGHKTGEYADDSWITTKVKSEMIADKTVDARNISVNTSDGVVVLGGTASNWTEANKAAEIAHSVKGVNRVQNNISY
jgi:hyperosmotically inducible periplasmic protein